jgi:hypothetical protein
MNKHISCPSRAIETISGYRRLCDQLETENEALRVQNLELRALLDRRIAPTFDFAGEFDSGVINASLGELTARSADRNWAHHS